MKHRRSNCETLMNKVTPQNHMLKNTSIGSMSLLVVGIIMHGLAAGGSLVNMAVILICVSLTFGLFIIGMAAFFREHLRLASRCFLLFFAIYLVFGGMARMNAEIFNPSLEVYQNFSDASTIYKLSIENWIGGEDLKRVTDVGGAIYVYSIVYDFFLALGLPLLPSIGIIFNTFLVATGSVLGVLAMARTFPGNATIVRVIIVMFATSGLAYMFAGMHLRDSFLYFFNAVLLVLIVRLGSNPSFASFIKTIMMSLVVVWLMTFFRGESGFVMIAVLAALVINPLMTQRNKMRIFLLVTYAGIFTVIAIVVASYFSDPLDNVRLKYILDQQESGGLAYEYVLQASIPVRIVFGTLYTIAGNIPFMIGFFLEEWYYWFAAIQSTQMLIVLPCFLFGCYTIIRDIVTRNHIVVPLVRVLVFYFVVATVVSLTTLGFRHFGQFLPFLYYIAAKGFLDAPREYKVFSLVFLGAIVPLAWVWAKLL